jgi:hypothetical protein
MNLRPFPADAEAAVPNKPEPPAEASRLWYCVLAVTLCLLVATSLAPTGRMRETARRSVDASNLSQVGQASLLYASVHQDRLPQAVDVWGYAGQLARDGGLNDAAIWTTGTDPANAEMAADLRTVLTADRASLDPGFAKLKPSWAVPLGELTVRLPPTTPIAWSRGLRPDGTWSPHGPYGADGGHIVFLAGNVAFYRNTRDAFVRFGGKGLTGNILEALPPGTRIGEYGPNEGEQREWIRARRMRQVREQAGSLIFPIIWLGVLLTLIVQTCRRRCPARFLIWFLWLSLLATVVLSPMG